MSKTQYSELTTKILNEETYANSREFDKDILLTPLDIELSETLTTPIRVLESTLLDLLLDEAQTARKIRDTKGKKLKLLFTRLGILENTILKVDETIGGLNDTLNLKVKLKQIDRG